MEFRKLYTPQGEKRREIPWQSYPRPQLQRDSFFCLNGQWEFAVTQEDRFPETYDRKITVPFAPQALLSGIGVHFGEEQRLYYRRYFRLPERFVKSRVLFHMGAADQKTVIRLNGIRIGSHVGGYLPMCFDITHALKEENCLEIRVTDDLRDQSLPYGKQCLKRGGMWYTPVSGIWQTVWLESVPERYIKELKIETKGDRVWIDARDPALFGSISVQTPQGERKERVQEGKVALQIRQPRLWSPEDPYLYRFTLELGEDRVASYFALRDLEIKAFNGIPRLCLNGKPYFFHGLLDQGYWSDGLFTPAEPSCYEEDISAMKALGFNTLRKHIKIEPEQFYYDCDRLGMIVFQDMVNNGPYSFFRDTALPTAGFQKRSDKRLHKDKSLRENFLKSMEDTVEHLKNHPCICYWTIFNEGWGQFESSKAYERLKKLDGSRFIDATSGWFRCGKSDVESLHIYFKPLKLPSTDKPLVLSEFGGYAYAPKEHVFNPNKTYGYAKYTQEKEFREAVEKLYTQQLLPLVKKGLCAAIYTQVSDVEDETNGVLTYDRRLCKLEEAVMRPIAVALQDAVLPCKTK